MARLSWTAVTAAAITLLVCSSNASYLPSRLLHRENNVASPSDVSSTHPALVPSSFAAMSGTTSVPLASASSAASVFSAQQSQSAIVPPIPLPTNVKQYEWLLALAPGLPPLQITSADPEAGDVNSEPLSAKLDTRSERNPFLHLEYLDLQALKPRSGPLRVMIVGDSMSQGQQGDWTWRYRIWQWFTANNVDVIFVGPYVGTVAPTVAELPVAPLLFGETAPPGIGSFTGGYHAGVDPSWVSNHYSAWGRAAATDQYLIAGVLEETPADMMLLMLGFNDLGWFYSDPSGTLQSIYNLIYNARSINPDISIAVANVPQRSSIGRIDLPPDTTLYNQLLAEAIPYWNENLASSKIALVELQQNYDCAPVACPAGYDGLHPNAMGEYEIAQAFSQTLHSSFGYGSGPLVIPGDIPPRPLPIPTNFQVVSSPQGITASWDAVYGAYSYDVLSGLELNGTVIWSNGSVPSNVFYPQWPLPDNTYEIYIRAVAGDQYGDWTAIESAVSKPQTAPAPSNIVVTATNGGITVTWDPPTGPYTDSIIEYNVILWDLSVACDFVFGAAFKESPAVITGLIDGDSYFVAVETWNANGEGFPDVVNDAIPGFGKPSTPGGLNIISTDATSVYYTWDAVPNAAGYTVFTRGINEASNTTLYPPSNFTTTSTCSATFFMVPGTWNFEFALNAFNGNNESPTGPWKAAPSPVTDVVPSPVCPTPPPWCAGGGQPWGPQPEPNPGTTGLPGQNGAPPSGDTQVITVTETINGKVTTIVETLVPMTTTNQLGQTSVYISIEGPTPTESPPAGATVTTLTSIGSDGTLTVVVETIFSFKTTNAQGSVISATSTEGGIFPGGGFGSGDKTETIVTTNAAGKSTTYTETLIPTTAMNSKGTTFVGTITEGPTTTPAPATGLQTYTQFPPHVTWYSTSVAHNTHGSSGPIFGPWPGCWFCPPGSDGIGLAGGFSLPGIYPPGGPPPGLPTPFPAITIGPDGDPTYPPAPSAKPTEPSATHSEPTSCSSKEVPRCTKTIVEVTSYIPGGGSTSTTISRSTITSCTTITACGGNPTTVMTTTATATTVTDFWCVPGSCGSGCNVRRSASPTAGPAIEISAEYDSSLSTFKTNVTLLERADGIFPAPGTGDWDDFYKSIEKSPGNVLLNNDDGTLGVHGTALTAVLTQNWGSNGQSVMVQGLKGCMSLIAVSQRGAYISHFYEGTAGYLFNDPKYFTPNVIDVLYDQFRQDAGAISPPTTSLFLMTPARGAVDNRLSSTNDPLASLPINQPLDQIKYQVQVDAIVETLKISFPETTTTIFTYLRQVNSDLLKTTGFGKAAVIFQPGKTGTTATAQVYMQAYSPPNTGTITFPYIDLQIWRHNEFSFSGPPLEQSTNIAAFAGHGQSLDPCTQVESEPAFLGFQVVPYLSDNINIDEASQAFDVPNGSGGQYLTGCTFSGTYQPQGSKTELVGTLTCDGGYIVNCYQPALPRMASDCGHGPLEGCSISSNNCNPYYEQVAVCSQL